MRSLPRALGTWRTPSRLDAPASCAHSGACGLLLLVTARRASPQRSDRAAADEAAWLQDVRLVFTRRATRRTCVKPPASVTIISAGRNPAIRLPARSQTC